MRTVLLLLEQGKCPLAIVQPTVPNAIVQRYEEVELPRGSLLRLSSSDGCGQRGKIQAELVSSVYFYGQDPSSERTFCIEPTALIPTTDMVYYSLAPPAGYGGQRVGEILTDLRDEGECGTSLSFAEGQVSSQELLWLQPLRPDQVAFVQDRQDQWIERFGPWALGRVWLTQWGRLALPLTYYTEAEMALEMSREGLQTPEQKEKAVLASGPSEHWLHFLGSDNKYSDVWGTPETIETIVTISMRWKKHCETVLAPSNPASCVVQIGDIAWYNDVRPDPLGHKDHYLGRCMDVRLFRTDASRYEAFWNKGDDRRAFDNAYDSQLTHAFVEFLRLHGGNPILFGDPSSTADFASGHDDHIHVCFPKQ